MNNLEWLIHRFQSRYPSYARDAVEYQANGEIELLVKFVDGDVLSYCEPEDLLCSVPRERDLDDYICFVTLFGKRLRQMMRHRGVSQIHLSKITSIPQPTISIYFNGHRTPCLHNLYKIARALDCSIDYFTYTWRKED